MFSLQWNMALFDFSHCLPLKTENTEKEGSLGLWLRFNISSLPQGSALHTSVRLQQSAGLTAGSSEHEVRKASTDEKLFSDKCWYPMIQHVSPLTIQTRQDIRVFRVFSAYSYLAWRAGAITVFRFRYLAPSDMQAVWYMNYTSSQWFPAPCCFCSTISEPLAPWFWSFLQSLIKSLHILHSLMLICVTAAAPCQQTPFSIWHWSKKSRQLFALK